MSDATPSLEELIQQAIDDNLCEVNTSIPAIVQSYDAATQTVSVKIALKKKYDTGEIVERPVITDIPVLFPKGKKFSFTWPIFKDDDGQLIFSQRSTEVWKNNAGVVDPADARKFSLSDAFFLPAGSRDVSVIPGVDATKTRLVNDKSILELDETGNILIKNDVGSVAVKADGAIEATNEVANIKLNVGGLVELNNENGTIRMTAAGKFKLQGASGKELLDIVDRFLDEMLAAKVLTAFGLQPFWPPTSANLTTIKNDLAAIKE